MDAVGFARIARVAPNIRGTLNRLVFTGLETCEWSFDAHAMRIRGTTVRPKALSALATVTLDRIGAELLTAGFARTQRTPQTDEWTDASGARIVLTQDAAETTDPVDALVREYAVLFTRTVPLSETLTIRASAPPAQLALWWRTHAHVARTAQADDPMLEDIVELVVRRASIIDDVRALPEELRTTVVSATTAFLESDECEWVIGRALTDARFSPGIVRDVVSRFRQLCERA